MNRVRLLNDGETIHVGDRTPAAIVPPYFDCPGTRGLWDPNTDVFYAVDSFGAPTPTRCDDVTDPRHELVDPAKVAARVQR